STNSLYISVSTRVGWTQWNLEQSGVPLFSTEVVYAEERSTAKRKNRETDSYKPAPSNGGGYAEGPSTAKMHRWSEWETMDMLNIMKANPSSFLDKAFWKRMSDFLHEAGQKDQTHNAVKSKWSKSHGDCAAATPALSSSING
ncbi:hypothetical protein MJO28_010135, partial [Puccinia striiformis f. sp. tritici]